MYSEEQARKLVIEAGNKLVEEGLVSRTWGNVSARCGVDEMIITPSGIAYDILKPEDLVKVNIVDLSYDGDVKPSSEKGIHAAIYEMRPDIHFVIHTHQMYASAVSAEAIDMEFAPCAEYALPGTRHLMRKVISLIKRHRNHNTFLLANHGALILGENMKQAFDDAELLEVNCREQVSSRLPSMDNCKLEEVENLDVYRTERRPFVKLVQNEFIAECAVAGTKVKPYLDDFAQMIGSDMKCVRNRASEINAGLIGRNAVLVKGVGAICIGKTDDECEVAAAIVSKNCAASCYVRKSAPLSFIDAIIQKYVFETKYSKRKNGYENPNVMQEGK